MSNPSLIKTIEVSNLSQIEEMFKNAQAQLGPHGERLLSFKDYYGSITFEEVVNKIIKLHEEAKLAASKPRLTKLDCTDLISRISQLFGNYEADGFNSHIFSFTKLKSVYRKVKDPLKEEWVLAIKDSPLYTPNEIPTVSHRAFIEI